MFLLIKFENDVKEYGIKYTSVPNLGAWVFEKDCKVNVYGNENQCNLFIFENDVKG